MVLSMWSNKSIEDIVAAVPQRTPLFQQVNFLTYPGRMQRWEKPIEFVLNQAKKAGFKAIFATADQPVVNRAVAYDTDIPKHIT